MIWGNRREDDEFEDRYQEEREQGYRNFAESKKSVNAFRLERVIALAKDHPNFNSDFVLSLKSQYDEKGYLTWNQEKCLIRIAKKFKINI